MGSGAARIRTQRPLREHHRVKLLQNLQRRDGGGRDRIVAVVEAVALGIAAEPAAEEAEHHPTPAVLPPAGERERVDGRERAALGARGRDLREGAEYGVDHP
jgi:hypothetical protein